MTKTLLKDIKKQRGLDILDQTIEQLFSNDSAGYISAYMYYVMNMRGDEEEPDPSIVYKFSDFLDKIEGSLTKECLETRDEFLGAFYTYTNDSEENMLSTGTIDDLYEFLKDVYGIT